MSTLSRVSLPCPGCGAPLEGEVAVLVALDRRPDLRAQILERRLNVIRCDCGRSVEIVRTFCALDRARGHWVMVYPRWAERHWRDLAMATAMSFVRNWQIAAPPSLAAESGAWRVRVVFGAERLREKLLIWDAACDDLALERGKLALMAGRPEWIGADLTLASISSDLNFNVFRDGARIANFSADLSLLDAPMPVGFSEDELRADPHVSARRFFVAPTAADPLTFDLDGRGSVSVTGAELRRNVP